MKIRADHPVSPMPAGPAGTLAYLRTLRGFDAAAWCAAKVIAINDCLAQARLSAVVIGVSGGLDSALAAALLARAAAAQDSPLHRIVLLALPAYEEEGVTGQSAAVDRARALALHLDRPLSEIDIAPPAAMVRQELGQSLSIAPKPWAAGQGVAIARTLALYQAASLLAQDDQPALVIGTTNRDEGAYLGYVGKASDGMVDLQVISDLHKSEVQASARHLGLPEIFLATEPTGDMFDACPDTAVFGAPYEAVELLILSRTLLRPQAWAVHQKGWTHAERAWWTQAERNLEQLHGYNAHKYLVRSPAVHLDLMDSAMPGGWSPPAPEPFRAPTTVLSSRACPRSLPPGDRRDWVMPVLPATPALDQDALRVRIKPLLSPMGLARINAGLDAGPWQLADRQGNWRGGRIAQAPEPAEGSWRATFEDPALAQALWETVRHCLPAFRHAHARSRFDEAGSRLWRPVGINPVFRAIAYGPQGQLVPHYDAPFVLDDRRRTGMSLVIYLDQQEQASQLRFLVDPQASLPREQCCFEDWTRAPVQEEIAQVICPEPGEAWVFDHYQLHDSAPLATGSKRLLRTDIIFERVGPA